MNTITVKRGDTIVLRCTRFDEDGELRPVDQAASTLKLGGAEIDFAVNYTDQSNGAFELEIDPGLSGTLIPGIGQMDVQFIDNGVVSSTETLRVSVIDALTNDP